MPVSRPILFVGPMVRAILENRKTQTRRVVMPQLPDEPTRVSGKRWGLLDGDFYYCGVRCPYGRPGDSLWVRETWQEIVDSKYCVVDGRPGRSWDGKSFRVLYRADSGADAILVSSWHPSIYMPRWASRITLEITGVRVERVQDISEDDAVAEGLDARPQRARDWYGDLWDSINAKRGFGWETNPWVWAITFKRVAP